MKKTIGLFVGIIVALQVSAQTDIFAPGGKALNGYDVVAFFKAAQPVKGADSLSAEWEGVRWLFSTRDNLDAFRADPAKYAPQYGGYCAYGTAGNHKSPTQPDTWTIVNDKLYFNYNQKVKEMWSKGRDSLIKKADENWPGLKQKKS